MKPIRTTPTISKLSSDEIVTVVISWVSPRMRAPMTGPYQTFVPPIRGMAIALTAMNNENAEIGSTKVTTRMPMIANTPTTPTGTKFTFVRP